MIVDELVGIGGANVSENGIAVLNSQSTGVSVTVAYKIIFSE